MGQNPAPLPMTSATLAKLLTALSLSFFRFKWSNDVDQPTESLARLMDNTYKTLHRCLEYHGCLFIVNVCHR